MPQLSGVAYTVGAQEVEVGGLEVQGLLGLHREPLPFSRWIDRWVLGELYTFVSTFN